MASRRTTVTDTTTMDDTRPSTLPPASRSLGSPQRRFRRRNVVGSTVLAVLVIAATIASFVELPYYRISPGSVYDTIERVEAPADRVVIPNGEIGFVTISQTADISVWQWLGAQFDDDVIIRHEDEINGDQEEAVTTNLVAQVKYHTKHFSPFVKLSSTSQDVDGDDVADHARSSLGVEWSPDGNGVKSYRVHAVLISESVDFDDSDLEDVTTGQFNVGVSARFN